MQDLTPKRKRPRRARKSAATVPARTGRDWVPFVIVFALAAALRVLYALASRRSPFFGHLDLDARFYDLWAKKIAAGDWTGHEVFFMGPLYPYFLAVVYRLFGPDLLVAKVVQSLLGGLTTGACYLLGKECFGRNAGLVAGFMAALYVPFIFYDNAILFPVLATLLNTLMLYLLYVGIHTGSERALLASGIFLGVSATGNASVLAFAPVAVVFLLAYGKQALMGRVRRAAMLVIGIAVVVSPVTIRNYLVGDDLVLLTSNAGLNLYIGNNPKSTGAYVKPDELDVYTDASGRSLAEAALGRTLKPSEVSAYWADRAAAFMKAEPRAFLSNLMRKFFFFWSVFEIPQIEHLAFESRYSWLLRIPSPTFGVVCPLGILGAILALRRRRDAWPLFLFMITYAAVIISFFVVARYRLPMVPALMAFAGYAVVRTVSAVTARNYRDTASIILGFVGLFLLVHVNFYRVDPMSGFAQSYYRLGIIYENEGKMEDALRSHLKAVELDPSLTAARVNAGILLSRQGDYERAKAELLAVIRSDPTYAKAYYNLGLVYSEQARPDSALEMMQRAVDLKGDYVLAEVGLASTYYEMGEFDRAEPLLVRLRDEKDLPEPSRKQVDGLLGAIPQRRQWTEHRARDYQKASDRALLRGDNLLLLGAVDRALEAYTVALDRDSLSAVAHFQVGTIYFNRGDLDGAEKHFDAVARLAPRYKGAHFALGVIAFKRDDIATACREFEEELKIDPSSAGSHINLAMCYEEHLKDYARAAYHISKYIELTGGTQELRDHLKELEKRIE